MKRDKNDVLFTLTKDNVVQLYPKVKLATDFVEDGKNQDQDDSFYDQCNSAFGVSLSDIGKDLDTQEKKDLVDFY